MNSGIHAQMHGQMNTNIKHELARLSLCPWAFPRGPAWGRDGAVGLGPPKRPQLHPWATNRSCKLVGEELEKVALVPSRRLLWRRPGHPIFLKERGGAERHLCRLFQPAPALRSSGRVSLTSKSPLTPITPSAGHGTKTRGKGNLGPQGAGEPGPQPAQGGSGADPVGCSPTRERCLTCGQAAEKEGEGRPQSQG